MAPNPYQPPRSPVARQPPPVTGSVRLLAILIVALKTLQLLATLWLLQRGVPAAWSLLDVALHFGAAVLLWRGSRMAIAPAALAAALGLVVSIRGGHLIPARAIYLIALPVLIALFSLRAAPQNS